MSEIDVEYLRRFHIGVCTESKGNCDYCDANNSSKMEYIEVKETPVQRNKKTENLSHKDKLLVYDNNYQLQNQKNSSRLYRTCYLCFLRLIWQNCNFLVVEEKEGEVYSTVRNISLKEIIDQISQSIHGLLCFNCTEVNHVPTISSERKIYYLFQILNNNHFK